jgi:outer membrane protein assembly factor BamB
VRTGRIVRWTADPTKGAIDPGAMRVANGVVYAGSYSGLMYALDAWTGDSIELRRRCSVSDGVWVKNSILLKTRVFSRRV